MSEVPQIAASHPSRVLVVDDEQNVCYTAGLIFEHNGFQVHRAYSAEEALQLFFDCKPDLAILDVNLGKMNGVELARRILTRDPNCRVLLFSGRPESEDLLNEASKQGYKFDVVCKPVHPKILLQWARNGIPEDYAREG